MSLPNQRVHGRNLSVSAAHMRTAPEGGADMLFLDARRIFTLPPLFEIREYSEFGPFNFCATAHYLGKGTHENLSANANRARQSRK